jgi:hypothetical protein
VIIPVVLLLIDLAALVLGTTSLDNITREAARAASAGDPAQAMQRAQQVVNQANATKSGIIARYTLDSAVPNNVQRPSATTGGVVQGTIDVNASVIVAPPFLLKALSGADNFKFSAHQSFPITFLIKQTVQPN